MSNDSENKDDVVLFIRQFKRPSRSELIAQFDQYVRVIREFKFMFESLCNDLVEIHGGLILENLVDDKVLKRAADACEALAIRLGNSGWNLSFLCGAIGIVGVLNQHHGANEPSLKLRRDDETA